MITDGTDDGDNESDEKDEQLSTDLVVHADTNRETDDVVVCIGECLEKFGDTQMDIWRDLGKYLLTASVVLLDDASNLYIADNEHQLRSDRKTND